MSRDLLKFLAVPVSVLFIAGCATTRAKKAGMPDADSQVVQMQTQLQALEQENQELRSQLESQERSSGDFSDRSVAASKSEILRVSGVTPTQLQKALRRAGYDPGPIDGRIGKKTRAAVKAFQRRQNLKADGIVGERTWSALQGA
jgi:murein L,D-transpeptidase YcbB/YkuD